MGEPIFSNIMEIIRFADDLAYADQPAFQDLRRLNQLGYRTIVNVRLPDEQVAPEGPDAARAGLIYVQIPVAQPDFQEEHFEALLRVLRDKPAPVLVHSRAGLRAGTLALVCHAARRGWTYARVAALAQRLGLDLPDAARSFLRREWEAHAGGA